MGAFSSSHPWESQCGCSCNSPEDVLSRQLKQALSKQLLSIKPKVPCAQHPPLQRPEPRAGCEHRREVQRLPNAAGWGCTGRALQVGAGVEVPSLEVPSCS